MFHNQFLYAASMNDPKEPVMGSPCGKRENCNGCPKAATCPVRAAALAECAAKGYDVKTWMKMIR